MGVLGARKSDFDALSAPRKWAVRFLVGRFQLGTPALYEQSNGIVWYVFSDNRIDRRFVETFFWALTKLIPQVTDKPAELGTDYTVTEEEDVLLAAATANGAPAWFTAQTTIPSGLSPVAPEEG